MPAVSKKQFRFMQAVAHGDAKAPGLSPGQAAEYVKGQSPKGLPMVKKPVGTRTSAVAAPLSPSGSRPAGSSVPRADHQRISHRMMSGDGVHSSGKGRR